MGRHMTLKLREKLLFPVVLTFAAGMVAGLCYSYVASTRAIEESVRKALVRETRNTSDLIDKWLDARHTDLLTWSRWDAFLEVLVETGPKAADAIASANTLLETLEKGYSYYDFLFIADRDGYLLSTSHSSVPKQYRVNDRDYFKASIQGRAWISDIMVSRESGKEVFSVSVPLRKDSRIIGVLAGAINVSDFSEFFIRGFNLGQAGFAYMAEESGQVFATSDKAVHLREIGGHDFGRRILEQGRGSLVYRHDDRHFLSAFETLGKKNWVFVVSQSLDEAFAPVRRVGWYTVGAGLALLLVVGAVVTGIFRRVVYQRFDRILDAIKVVEQGNLSVRIQGEESDDEIGTLTHAFNRMTARLETTLSSLQREIQVRREAEKALANHRDNLEIRVSERTAELLTLRNYLSDIINSMPSVIVGVTHDMKISQWNQRAEEVTGIDRERAVGCLFDSQFSHLTHLVGEIQEAIRKQEVFYRAKVERDGDCPGYDDITVYPLRDKILNGAVIRIDDVTDRAALEEVMIQSEKMMSVGGLAAGMAHEINNPLAGIIQNLQVLKNRMSRHMPKNASVARELGLDVNLLHDYMDRRGMFKLMDSAVRAGARAAKIVDNMLSFSRKDQEAAVPVALPELMDRTIELARSDYTLKKRFKFMDIEIVREYRQSGLTVSGHPGMLQQVFFNLLKNGTQAMSESQDCRSPRFVISMAEKGGQVRIKISDNGPGMDTAVSRRIFEPFFTTKKTGKGTGLGLSVSYFIISETHGGKIEVLSESGRGTTFVIHLPAA